MRLFPLPSLFAAAAPALSLLAACSLSLEDPELEAKKKLAKQVEPTWELLEGRWLGDSTYTVFDAKSTPLFGALILDVFPDSTVWARDPTGLVFPGTDAADSAPSSYAARAAFAEGRLRLSGAPGNPGPDTLAVRMRFLGNWLELERRSDRRTVHFHKLKHFDSAAREALLDSGIWLRRAVRISYDTLRPDSLRRDFDYLAFPGDSLRRESRRGGLARTEAGPIAPAGSGFAWRPEGGERSLRLDLFHADSLRMWPMAEGRADSGYSLYVRARGPHPLDLDMTAYAGHLRTDTVRIDRSAFDTHFGRFYDLVLGVDHAVRTLTNMPSMPRFDSWEVDSGFLWLDGEGDVRTRFRVEKPSPKALTLVAGATPAFSRPTTLIQTLVDGSRFEDHPLERFDQAPYLRVAAGPADTFAFYFQAAYRKQDYEGFEISGHVGDDTLWAAWRLDGSETYSSGQDGFFFAFQGRTADLGRFTCRGIPSLDLTIRTLAGSSPELASGLIQGACRIIASELPPADSALEITGDFRGRRRADILQSPLWKLP